MALSVKHDQLTPNRVSWYGSPLSTPGSALTAHGSRACVGDLRRDFRAIATLRLMLLAEVTITNSEAGPVDR